MSVFTRVDFDHLQGFLKRYSLGSARALQPIAAGVTNSNYYLDTDAGRFILTLYEIHRPEDLDYILGLQQHLSGHGIRCATPVADRDGRLYSELNRRPAAIIERLPGSVESPPRDEHCRAVAAELARFHLVGKQFNLTRPNPRGREWMIETRQKLDRWLDAEDIGLIDAALETCRTVGPEKLPGGAIHGDLFHDNALFVNSELGGILDFDYACSDSFCFDLAILLNDWCLADGVLLDQHRATLTLEAYRQVRELTRAEVEALPAMLAMSALRFWLSRLHDKHCPLPGEMVLVKPPEAFRAILAQRLGDPYRSLADTKTRKDSAE